MSIAETKTPPIEYPSGDGQPMAETWLHVQAIMWLHQALEDFFRSQHQPETFVASDLFWYWQEGNPALKVAPDVMVIPGVGVHPRRSFFSWEENGAIPAVVFEMASENTWREDLDDKYDRYEQLGVREYFLFDPEGLYLVPRLQGYRLNGTAYRRLRQTELTSELGFGLRAEDTMLRLIDLRTGQPIPTRAEAVEAERQRADTEKFRADAEKERADAEKERADVLQAELDRLRAQLKAPGDTNGSGS
jgi:Uma2 family endonuclease